MMKVNEAAIISAIKSIYWLLYADCKFFGSATPVKITVALVKV